MPLPDPPLPTHGVRADGRHLATRQLARWFDYGHLQGRRARSAAAACATIAEQMIEELDDGPELSAGLRKLLEAKDCFVRAAIDTGFGAGETIAPAHPGVTAPAGCVCAYTWSTTEPGRAVRNGPRADCTADHTGVDAPAST